jgi:hypothetical protein
LSKKVIYGNCALCGKKEKLTFEHIPPKEAFNSSPARPVTGDKIVGQKGRLPWDTSGLRYENLQQGMGKTCLCEGCNNNTGSWYANEYISFAHTIHKMLTTEDLSKNKVVKINDVYPLRLIKQVLSNFCSINNDSEDERFRYLGDFVLNKETKGLDKTRYKLCMYFTKSNFTRYAPYTVVGKIKTQGYDYIAVSEITSYPLGFVLYFEPTDTWVYEGVDITEMANYGYDDLCDIELPLCIKEVNDLFPTFYRTKEEIEACVKANEKWARENFEKDKQR